MSYVTLVLAFCVAFALIMTGRPTRVFGHEKTSLVDVFALLITVVLIVIMVVGGFELRVQKDAQSVVRQLRVGSIAATQLAATVAAERTLETRYGRYSTCIADLKAISPTIRTALAENKTTIRFSLAPVIQQLTVTVGYDTGDHSASRLATIDTADKQVLSCTP